MNLRLQNKATLTIGLLVVIILTASSYFFYDAAKRALDAEMGERLVAIAKTAATQLNGQFLGALQPGSESRGLYQSRQKNLQLAAGEVQSLNQLVTEFLDFARPIPLQTQAVDLSSVVDSVLTLLDSELRAGEVEIHTLNMKSLPTIEADSEQLKWVFTNLVKNAAQAMPQGGTITIEGFASTVENGVRVEVRDTGMGMSPETVERAFTPFFTTKDTGTGLGLAVVKRLIENHHRTIECRSEEGGGTTFVLKLPITWRKSTG